MNRHFHIFLSVCAHFYLYLYTIFMGIKCAHYERNSEHPHITASTTKCRHFFSINEFIYTFDNDFEVPAAMKRTPSTQLLLYTLCASYVCAIETQQDSAIYDDQKFWLRFLQGDTQSFPTKSPIQPFPTPVVPPSNCIINSNLECISSDGVTKCGEMGEVNGKCAYNSNFNFLQFQLNAGRNCEQSTNVQESICLDCTNVTTNEIFRVLCKNAVTGEDLSVSPENLVDGQIFTVSPALSQLKLPERIDCIYLEQVSKKIQQNIIDTSGFAPLYLKDKFGAFTLQSCEYGSPDRSLTKTCLETLSYTIGIKNEGSVDVLIQQLNLTLSDGFSESILDEIGSPLIIPGDSVNVTYLKNIDRCVNQQICSSIDVKAVPTNGNTRLCEDYSRLCFNTFVYTPPKVSPVTPPIKVSVPMAVPTLPTVPVSAPNMSKFGMSKTRN